MTVPGRDPAHDPGIRRFPLIWAGFTVILGCAVLAGLTEVEGIYVFGLAQPAAVLYFVTVAAPLRRFAADEALPGRVVATSVAVAVGGCLWILSSPHNQGVAGTYAALPGLVGAGGLSPSRIGLWSTVAASALVVAFLIGLVNWRLCGLEARRRAASP